MTTAIDEKVVKSAAVKTAQVKQESQKLADPNVFAQRVEKKAYELYEQRGRQDGRDCDDWFKALEIVEREMIEGK